MSTIYPREIFASVRENRSLAIMANFTRAAIYDKNGKTMEDPDIPLAVYDKKFSRLVFSGIDSEHQCSASANIPVSELAGIFAVSDYAFTKQMDAVLMPKEDVMTSPAYTVKIGAGALKGKTPAEVLLEDPESGSTALNNQYKWLNDNLAKYPKNQIQMDAIKDAARLLKEGKLNAADVKKSTVINIYNAEARALTRKKREDGMCPVYNIDITWNVGEEAPVEVTIKYFYAPVIIQESGRINPQISQMDKSTFIQIKKNLYATEWMDAIRRIKTAMSQFEMVTAKQCIEEAEKAERESRAAAGIA